MQLWQGWRGEWGVCSSRLVSEGGSKGGGYMFGWRAHNLYNQNESQGKWNYPWIKISVWFDLTKVKREVCEWFSYEKKYHPSYSRQIQSGHHSNRFLETLRTPYVGKKRLSVFFPNQLFVPFIFLHLRTCGGEVLLTWQPQESLLFGLLLLLSWCNLTTWIHLFINTQAVQNYIQGSLQFAIPRQGQYFCYTCEN